MIRFFLSIRQSLLAQGRITRYLTYAIGEIVLVVIGILIALQVNIANIDRSEREAEEQYITSLIDDLAMDTTRYAYLIDRYKTKELRIDSILTSFGQLSVRYDHALYSRMPEVISYVDFIYTDKTIRQLMNAGSMRLIRNKEIVNAIIDYDSSVRRLLESLMPDLEFYYRNANQTWFEVMDIAAHEADMARLTVAEMESGNKTYLLRSDQETLGKFNNIIRNFQGDVILVRRMEEDLMEKATRLIDLLERTYALGSNKKPA